MHYPCSENKGADQLRGFREADLHLTYADCCFLMRQLIFYDLHVKSKEEMKTHNLLRIYEREHSLH